MTISFYFLFQHSSRVALSKYAWNVEEAIESLFNSWQDCLVCLPRTSDTFRAFLSFFFFFSYNFPKFVINVKHKRVLENRIHTTSHKLYFILLHQSAHDAQSFQTEEERFVPRVPHLLFGLFVSFLFLFLTVAFLSYSVWRFQNCSGTRLLVQANLQT